MLYGEAGLRFSLKAVLHQLLNPRVNVIYSRFSVQNKVLIALTRGLSSWCKTA